MLRCTEPVLNCSAQGPETSELDIDDEEKDDGSWRSMLAARPVQNQAARIERHDRDRVTVYVKRKRPGYLVPPISWIMTVRPERRVTLDALGTRIWTWCDGNRTVEDVVDLFAATYNVTFHEARVAVTGYLRSLLQRGVVAIVMQE